MARLRPIKAKIERAGVVGAKFGAAKGRLSKELEQSVSEMGQAVKRVYKFWAPKRTGRLQKGISVRKSGKGRVDISVTAVSDSGYSYVGVTRFGHRVTTIQPRNNLVLKLNLPGGFWAFAPVVKGYNPKYDWAEEAFHSAQEVAEQHAHKLSQRLQLRALA